MNELEIIQHLTRSLPSNPSVVLGPGDDCAILDLGLPGRWLLFKTDAVVEGVHFAPDAAPEQIGHKALARALSDIAAMAGTPTAALVTLGLPAPADPARLARIYQGMNSLAARHAVAIVGGEITANPAGLLISIALLGTAAPNHCPRRSGAQPADAIFVTGDLGGSLAGKHLAFEPRLAEARWLAQTFDVHAMIDLSDGLASDLRHMLNASHVGAELLKSAIPVSRAARQRRRENTAAKPPLLAALTDGEDFELLFTVASRDAVPLLDRWKQQFAGLPLSCIGKITVEPGLRLRGQGGVQPFTAHGYVHLEQP